MKQKRVFIFLVLITATLMVFSACGGSSNRGLDDVVNYYEENGFDIGGKEVKVAEMIGAEDGFGIYLNDSHVELYLYEKGSPGLAEIKQNGEYDMEIFVVSAIANGNLVLMGYDGHPDEDEIVKLFNDF